MGRGLGLGRELVRARARVVRTPVAGEKGPKP